MGLKLYGHPGATCTKRVIITLTELNLPYTLVKLDLLKGDQKQPEYVAKHPFGKIPYLEDGEGEEAVGFAESRAICRYLANKYGRGDTTLIPSQENFKAFAQFEEAASFEEQYFDVYAKGAALEYHFAPLHGRSPDQEAIKKNLDQLDDVLKVYDQILSKQKYTAGDHFTIVDIFHGPHGWLVQQGVGAKESFDKYPNVQRWWGDITGRKSFKALEVTFG